MSGRLFVSIDGEFTGGIPWAYSMISMGAVAYDDDGREQSNFKMNLKELPHAGQDQNTMDWWRRHPDAWKAATEDPVDPKVVMQKFDKWLGSLERAADFIGWPVPDDYMFFTWYYEYFLHKDSPLRFKCIDIKSYAMRAFNRHSTSDISRTDIMKYLELPTTNFSHDPLDDARRQAELFFALKKLLPS